MEKAITKVPEEKTAEVPTLALTAKDLKKVLKEEQARRDVLRDYIKHNFREGVHFSRTCRRKIDGKWKPIYLKKGEEMMAGDEPGKDEIHDPGAQTAIDVMKCSYEDGPDKEMIEVLGDAAKEQIILKGAVKDSNDKIKGYGRGACSLKEKYGSINNAIKQGQIRCKRNAVINAFALGDLFLQDVDDVNAQDLAKKLDAQKDERSSMMKKYIDNIMKESKVTERERKGIELVFDNGIELYNILRFVNEVTDPEVIQLMGEVGKNGGRAHVMEIAKDSRGKLSEFKSMMESDIKEGVK